MGKKLEDSLDEMLWVYLSVVVFGIARFLGQYCDNIYNVMRSHSATAEID